jgi:hypothetical protein
VTDCAIRVKWSAVARRWIEDPRGIPEAEACRHGFIGLTRRDQLLHVVLDDDPVPDVVLTRRDARLMVAFLKRLSARLAERRSAREARIAEKAALRAERQAAARARRKIYFAAWYSLNRAAVAARRKAQRQSTRATKHSASG